MILPWHQYLLAIVFILAGVSHFKKPEFYKKIIPSHLLQQDTLILASGILKMVVGLMLINPNTQTIAAWGMMIVLTLFLLIHIYLQNKNSLLKPPKWIVYSCIILLFGMMYWAFQYTS